MGRAGVLGGGLLLLLSELTAPARGLLLWQSFSNQTSWMAFGAWAALLALVFFALTAIVVTRPIEAAIERKWPGFATKKRRIATVLTVIGMVLALCVAVYTGMLLMAVPAVSLWDTPLLPCLFTVFAIDTGVALVEIAALAVHRREPLTHRARKLLERSVVVLVLVEGVVLAAYVGIMATGNGGGAFTHGSAALTAALSAWTLTSGELAPFFWGLLVACGLVLPLVMAVIGLGKTSGPQRGKAKPRQRPRRRKPCLLPHPFPHPRFRPPCWLAPWERSLADAPALPHPAGRTTRRPDSHFRCTASAVATT